MCLKFPSLHPLVTHFVCMCFRKQVAQLQADLTKLQSENDVLEGRLEQLNIQVQNTKHPE